MADSKSMNAIVRHNIIHMPCGRVSTSSSGRGMGTGIERPIASRCVRPVDTRPLGRGDRKAGEILRMLKVSR